jgi:hypothetical protein
MSVLAVTSGAPWHGALGGTALISEGLYLFVGAFTQTLNVKLIAPRVADVEPEGRWV